jgi:hypothetical protein
MPPHGNTTCAITSDVLFHLTSSRFGRSEGLGIGRRQYSYDYHILERRSGKERRSGLDRRIKPRKSK